MDEVRISDTYEIVKRAWTETLPAARFDPEQGWEDAGADSLKSLHLVLRLEKALGRTVPFDLISREMTARDLALLLDGEGRETVQETGLPTVFLVPGLFGDGPILAEFRRSFGGDLRFEVVDLPDIGEPLGVHRDMAASGRFVGEEILRRTEEKEIYLSGFSFGGTVAFEAAHHLQRKGRVVRFLGLLDSMLLPNDPEAIQLAVKAEAQAKSAAGPVRGGSAPDRLRRGYYFLRDQWILFRRKMAPGGGGLRSYIDHIAFDIAVASGRLEQARKLAIAQRESDTQERFVERRKFLLGEARRDALIEWRPEPLDVPAFLVCTDAGAFMKLPARWGRQCPRLRTVRVPGQHLEMFEPAALRIVTPAFLDAVTQAAEGDWT